MEGKVIVTDTSIAISTQTKKRLEFIKIHPRETFEDVLIRLLDQLDKQEKK
jgi:hypothetical protein